MNEQISDFSIRKTVNFSDDKILINKIRHLTAPMYCDNTTLLEREINHCKNILYFDNEYGELMCFAMYNFESLEELETVYFGLTVCGEKYKKFGLAKRLWREVAKETIKRENILKTPILCWLTTPTPIVFYWFNKFLEDAEPFLDGTYTVLGKQVVEKLKRVKYPAFTDHQANPFVLLRIASNTTYSINEKESILIASKKLGLKAFSNLNVDETNGDRFLIIGFVPKNEELL
jgi:hypothetical protein